VRAFLPPLTLLAAAGLAWFALDRIMMHRRDRIRADMPDATVDERTRAAVAKGHTGELILGTFATLAVAATGAIWLLMVLVGVVS